MTSCNKDGCTDPEAINYDSNAKDDDGSCDLPRDSFLGTYTVQENCDGDTHTYNDLVITASDENSTDVFIANFYTTGVFLNASILGNAITIASQPGGTPGTFEGSGTITGNTLTIDFTFNNENCTMTATK